MLRGARALRQAVSVGLALAVAAICGSASAGPKTKLGGGPAPLTMPKKKPSAYLEVPDRDEVLASPAYRYANMSNEDALAELDRRGVRYHTVEPIGGVRQPIRLDGDLHGVEFHSSLPVDQRATSMFEILDARLALSLDDFAVILARHDVVEVVHYTMYRPNVAEPGSKPAPDPSKNSKDDPKSKKGRSDTKKVDASGPVAERAGAKREAGPHAKRRAALDEKAQQTGKPGRRATTSFDSKKKDAEIAKGEREAPTAEVSALGCGHDHELGPAPATDALAKLGPAPQKPAARRATAPGKPALKADAPAKPDARPPGGKKGKSAKKRILPQEAEISHARWAPPGTRHPAGLAIDVGILKKSDGSVLNVAQHFHGKIGDKTCGPDVPEADTPEARELRAIVCEARESEVFTYTLTPNFNADHFDHFHMEIKPGVEWFLYH